jgi:hypothetical protein
VWGKPRFQSWQIGSPSTGAGLSQSRSYDLTEPIPDEPTHGMSAGQTGVDIVRYNTSDRSGPPDTSHYVIGIDARRQHLWDDWYDSEESAREAIVNGQYGDLIERGRNAG